MANPFERSSVEPPKVEELAKREYEQQASVLWDRLEEKYKEMSYKSQKEILKSFKSDPGLSDRGVIMEYLLDMDAEFKNTPPQVREELEKQIEQMQIL